MSFMEGYVRGVYGFDQWVCGKRTIEELAVYDWIVMSFNVRKGKDIEKLGYDFGIVAAAITRIPDLLIGAIRKKA